MNKEDIKFKKTIGYISKIYDKLTYFDVYGGSVFLMMTLIIALVLYYTNVKIEMEREPIKRNWSVHRCNPAYMPFAGQIIQPPDISKFEFTNNNAKYCMNKVLESIVNVFFFPIQYILMPILGMWKIILQVINAIRKLFNRLRNAMAAITKEITGRVVSLMIPFQKVMIAVRDMFAKIRGIFVTSIFQVIGAYYALKSFLGAVLELTLIFIIALAAAIIIAWMMPWTWGAAIAMTAIFIALVIPLAIMAGFLENDLGIRSRLSIPRKPNRPACFHADTVIETTNGPRKISELTTNDVLNGGGKITSIFEVSTEDNPQQIFNLHGVVVSGSHYVFYGDKWILVKDHPSANIVVDPTISKLYCLNTMKKCIVINNVVFSDWDEFIRPNEVYKFMSKLDNGWITGKLTDSQLHNPDNIHKLLSSGLFAETQVKMFDGNDKFIQDIQIGDRLGINNYVLGKVLLDGSQMIQGQYYLDDHQEVKGSANLVYISNVQNKNLAILTNYHPRGLVGARKRLYQLITTSGVFKVGETYIFDYDKSMDYFE
tara:strand:- start:634 stop:2256 length:1623 start_codon:yes stop_codon:yes gene_type:complete